MSDDPLAIRLRYAPHNPTPRQHAFLLLDDLGIQEAMYGGAAGGGKSDAMLMSALRYVHVPGYSALLLRRTFADLNLPGSLIDRSKLWLMGTDARWNATDSRWTFPSGATLSFGYVQHDDDVYRYASAEFQFIGWDEGTQFKRGQYTFLFSRLRRPTISDQAGDETTDEEKLRVKALAAVPLRVRMATNPGGRGHAWVKSRFVDKTPGSTLPVEDPLHDPEDTPEKARKRVFIPAMLTDNPHIDQEGYEASLGNLDPQRRAQLLSGDWNARPPGDWVYDDDHIQAAEDYGSELDQRLVDGTIQPPAGEQLVIGIDWGEHTHALVGWPLVGGGMYVAMEVELLGVEPTESTREIIGGEDDDGEWQPGILGDVMHYASRPRGAKGLHPPIPRRKGRDDLAHVAEHRYDAAGVQTMKTYMKLARARYRTSKSEAIAFGADAPRSGRGAIEQTYKAETIGYIRMLLKRTYDERETKTLAISPDGCPRLLTQMRGLKWKDQEAGKVEKVDDHGPDSLIALLAPDAKRSRDTIGRTPVQRGKRRDAPS